MAKAVAVEGLVASIAALIDLSGKVAARLEFISQGTEVPNSVRDLTTRLPLLNTSLQAISTQAQAGYLSQDAVVALHAVISGTSQQVTLLQTRLDQIVLPSNTSRLQREIRALKSPTKEEEMQTTIQKVHQDIDFLVLHRTTRDTEAGERILAALAQLQLGPVPPSPSQARTTYPHISAHDRSYVHAGDVHHHYPPVTEKVTLLGWCLGLAPSLDTDKFVGRLTEIERMHNILHPSEPSTEQRRLVLGGMGGIGKTQLAIAYARHHRDEYTSVLWLNATSTLTLRASMGSLIPNIVRENKIDHLNAEQTLTCVHTWLCSNRNTQWLLILDNYDEPDQFSIDEYLPNCSHGSLIITTRLPDAVRGQQVRVQPLADLKDSLKILQTRSHRSNAENDTGARRLATRLDGFPLALATAGAYLRKTDLTFEEYLDAYEQRFNINPRRPTQLPEYPHTLSTTWEITYDRLKRVDPPAAQILRLLAYFDNQEIWYTLLHGGLDDDMPAWLQEVAGDRIEFGNVMGTLVEYCMVEAH